MTSPEANTKKHFRHPWLRNILALVLHKLRVLRDTLNNTSNHIGERLWRRSASRWVNTLIAVARMYVLFWTRRTVVYSWLAFCTALFLCAFLYDFTVASRGSISNPVIEKTADGTVRVTTEARLPEGFYSHYRIGPPFESVPLCHEYRSLGQEALSILGIMIKAPLTTFIDTVQQIPRLEFFQWAIAGNLLADSQIGKYLDHIGPASARCVVIFAPAPPEHHFKYQTTDPMITLSFRNEPGGTDGCGADEHLVPIDGRTALPCGWMAAQRTAPQNGESGIAFEIRNWLHDKWRVDRIFRLTVEYKLKKND